MTSPLALFGGTAAVTAPTPHFTWPPIDGRAVSAVVSQLQSAVSIYDRSGVIAELEDALRCYFGARHAVLTASGTAALYDLYAACRIRPGDEVIVPAYTFFATVTPLLHLGAIPVLADCDERGNLDPADVARRITQRTSGIVVTHMWGVPADAAALRTLADAHELFFLEDGSHAHGASSRGRKIGTFGRGAAFSMNGPKPLSAGEGGFILTDDDETYYDALLHGQYNKRCRNEIPAEHRMYPFAVTGMGLKHRIHPLAASIALGQLDRLDEYLEGRTQIAAYLLEHLDGIPGIRVPKPDKAMHPSWYGLVLQYQPDELDGLPAGRYHDALLAEGCAEADRPGSTCPLNLLPLFQDPGELLPAHKGTFAYQPGDFPQAEAFHAGAIKLPVWHREEHMRLAGQYVEAFRKVSASYRSLLG
jgi:dTDP-4-amino-4,6-dideoxygalactose transaminase